jgi:hypothetical protein
MTGDGQNSSIMSPIFLIFKQILLKAGGQIKKEEKGRPYRTRRKDEKQLTILLRKSESLERPMRRLEDNIKMGLK